MWLRIKSVIDPSVFCSGSLWHLARHRPTPSVSSSVTGRWVTSRSSVTPVWNTWDKPVCTPVWNTSYKPVRNTRGQPICTPEWNASDQPVCTLLTNLRTPVWITWDKPVCTPVWNTWDKPVCTPEWNTWDKLVYTHVEHLTNLCVYVWNTWDNPVCTQIYTCVANLCAHLCDTCTPAHTPVWHVCTGLYTHV